MQEGGVLSGAYRVQQLGWGCLEIGKNVHVIRLYKGL